MKTFRVTVDVHVDDTDELKDIQDDWEQICLGEFESAQVVSVEEMQQEYPGPIPPIDYDKAFSQRPPDKPIKLTLNIKREKNAQSN